MADSSPTTETINIAVTQTDNLCDHYIFCESAPGTPSIKQYNVLKLRLNVRNVTGKIPNANGIGFKLLATGNTYAGVNSDIYIIAYKTKEIENMTDGTYTIEIPIYNTFNESIYTSASYFRPGATEDTQRYYMLVIYIRKQDMTYIICDTVFLFKNTGVENVFNNMFKTTYSELRSKFHKIAEVMADDNGGDDE